MPDNIVLIVTGPATVTASGGVRVVYGHQKQAGKPDDIKDNLTVRTPEGKTVKLSDLKGA